mmetsp:Transcript_43038/g.93615  ORF Transcript_43038/g.93615 Transcript_43038/m.93615 type:complete len:589 (-) Transcript_43038:33-1799(-)
MGRAILADGDGVMRRHEDRAALSKRGQADGIAHVVAEDREGRAVRDKAGLVQGHGVGNGTHAELTDAEAHVAALVAAGKEVPGALHQGHVRGRQVRGATDEIRHRAGDGVQAVLRVQARGLARILRGVDRQALLPVLRQLPVDAAALELRRELGLRLLVLSPQLVPLLLLLGARIRVRLEGGVHLVRHLELAVLPAELVTGGLRLLLAQGRAVGIVAVRLVRGAEANHGLDLDQRRLVRARLRVRNGLPDGIHVLVAVRDGNHLPAVRLVALAHILGEGELGVAINGDAVVIVEDDELAQLQVARIRAGLVRDALLHAAIAHDAVGVVVDEGHARLVVNRGKVGLRRRKADGVGDTHAQRARGHLNALSLEVLRVARRLRAPLTELLDVIHGDAGVAREVEHGVLQHAAVAGGQHEAVAVDPLGVLRVEIHLLREEAEADRRLAHGRARVAAVGLVDRIDGEEADGVDAVGRHLGAHLRGHGLGRHLLALAGTAAEGRGGGRQREAARRQSGGAAGLRRGGGRGRDVAGLDRGGRRQRARDVARDEGAARGARNDRGRSARSEDGALGAAGILRHSRHDVCRVDGRGA